MTRGVISLVMGLFLARAPGETAQNFWSPNWVLPDSLAREIEGAAPDRPCVPPVRPRKLLVYGRRPTHPGSVVCCFKAIETLGKKTGAFDAVASGDPLVLLPESLAQFDAVLMNNTHESHPMLPVDFDRLGEERKAAARAREAILQESLLDFVAAGKGIVGIHAAVATGWKEYLAMMGGPFGGHITTNVWIKANQPAHPICAPLKERGLQIFDEVYISAERDFSKGLRVLLSLDLGKMPDPGKRDDGDYSVSWIRSHGKGRVFYCSLGHEPSTYANPTVLRHYLAGIQFAMGDLEADVGMPRRNAEGHDRTGTSVESRVGHILSMPSEAPGDREARHRKIAERRVGPAVIVHRGAWAFAPENTLEAYAAAMDLGADGCEIDIRRTADGVLVMFHDDGLDRMTDGLGGIDGYTYAELLALRFRSADAAGRDARIPTLAAVLELARQRAMLLHLDIKQPELEEQIARMFDDADMWDHIVEINAANAGSLRENRKAGRLAYKAFGWQEARMDVNPDRVREGLAKSGDLIMVDDPRVVCQELKRKGQRVPLSKALFSPPPTTIPPRHDGELVSPAAHLHRLADRMGPPSFVALEKFLADHPPAEGDFDAAQPDKRARRILERAWAARMIGKLGEHSARAVRLLEDLIASRSLHENRAYNGLDGAVAARSLGELRATESAPFLIRTFLAVDPALQKLVKPPANYSWAWADYRLKRELICALGDLPCEASLSFLREYLAMDKLTAGRSAPPLFEEATLALLRHGVTSGEAERLLQSPNSAVRGATILACLDDRRCDRAELLRRRVPWTQQLARVGD